MKYAHNSNAIHAKMYRNNNIAESCFDCFNMMVLYREHNDYTFQPSRQTSESALCERVRVSWGRHVHIKVVQGTLKLFRLCQSAHHVLIKRRRKSNGTPLRARKAMFGSLLPLPQRVQGVRAGESYPAKRDDNTFSFVERYLLVNTNRDTRVCVCVKCSL